jgi:segregation and condensation protein B
MENIKDDNQLADQLTAHEESLCDVAEAQIDDAPAEPNSCPDEFEYTDSDELPAESRPGNDDDDGDDSDDESEGGQQFEWSPDIDEEFLEDEGPEPTIESVIEAVLFTTDEPVTGARLVKIADLSSTKQVSDAVKLLNERYEESNSAFRIEKIAGGYQMLTHKIYNNWLRRLVRVRTESKLTQASLETLAIVAYKQPIIRADVEAIRGVSSGEMIRGLMSKGLVKIAGRAQVLGRPMQYGTTRKFLETFGLNSLRDLPKADELKKPRD